MKGFEINIGGKTVDAAVLDGGCGVSMSYDTRIDKCSVSVNGVEKSGVLLKWYEGELHDGDEVIAVYGDVPFVSECIPVEMPNSGAGQIETAKKIYYSLRPELLAAGLIDE